MNTPQRQHNLCEVSMSCTGSLGTMNGADGLEWPAFPGAVSNPKRNTAGCVIASSRHAFN